MIAHFIPNLIQKNGNKSKNGTTDQPYHYQKENNSDNTQNDNRSANRSAYGRADWCTSGRAHWDT